MRAVKSLHVPERNSQASLGIVPSGVLPNLTRFTQTVSRTGAQIFKSLVSADSTTAAYKVFLSRTKRQAQIDTIYHNLFYN